MPVETYKQFASINMITFTDKNELTTTRHSRVWTVTPELIFIPFCRYILLDFIYLSYNRTYGTVNAYFPMIKSQNPTKANTYVLDHLPPSLSSN